MRAQLIGVSAWSLFIPGAICAHHPPEEAHRHPHNSAHATVEPDNERFITSRSGTVKLPLPNEEDAFFFVVFGDRTGGPAEGVEVLADAVRDTNLLEPDLVMTVGDLVEGYNERPAWLSQMKEFRSIMNQLLCPWFPVAGNHDIYWRGDNRPPDEHEGDYESHFGPLWYAFEHKNCWFIVLYSDEPDPQTGERNFNKPESQQMSAEQFAWLEQVLERTRSADHVFVFLHHPRWLGGNYGDDWERVHAALAEAGNVAAVFAGHIHTMRYDGPRDGIEYVTLATVGGAQSHLVPKAGYLHHFHVVTVRKNQIAMAAVPVGEVMDIRAITGEVSVETRRLATEPVTFSQRTVVAADGSATSVAEASFRNSTARPIDLELTPASEDSRWRFEPDHRHARIDPGESFTCMFQAFRQSAPIDDTFAIPYIVRATDYLTQTARIPIPDRRDEIPLQVELVAPDPADLEGFVAVDGRGQYLSAANDLFHLPDGPLTVECWIYPQSFAERTGVLCKTENSEYGIFANGGVPSFSVFLGERYTDVVSRHDSLELNAWHHLAGVFDGEQVRLYVNGRLVASADRSGVRRRNRFPLLIGADVDGRGRAVSPFHGWIDGVRISSVARYAGDEFVPVRRLKPDDQTVLLLNMDGRVGPYVFDDSNSRAHPRVHGGADVLRR